MDVVYVCGSQVGEEFRYSLRSLTNLRHGRVWTAGHKPDWTRTAHIPVDQSGGKYANVLANVQAVLDCSDVSDPFALFNDDFFVMQSLSEVSVLHCGPVARRLSGRNGIPFGQYRADLMAAQELLEMSGRADPLCYDLHVPMIIHKDLLRDTFALIGDRRMLWQTVHGNVHGLGGEYHPDSKVRTMRDVGHDGPFLSTDDRTFRDGAVGRRIRAAFPEPSEYER